MSSDKTARPNLEELREAVDAVTVEYHDFPVF